MDRLKGKVAIVTGAALGIGRATAVRMAEEGAAVALFDILDEPGEVLAKELQGRGFKARYWHCQVTAEAEVAAAIDAAAAHFGRLDVLVNNAGVSGANKPTHEITEAEWDFVQGVNVKGVFFCTKHAIPHLKRAGGGSIINLSSIAGRLAYPLRTPYAAAKWGVIGLTKSLAAELGPSNIRVNAILPGVVEGERVNRVVAARAEARGIPFEQAMAQFVAPVSLRRMIKAEDIANMALFLATAAGASISGQALSVCGDHSYLG